MDIDSQNTAQAASYFEHTIYRQMILWDSNITPEVHHGRHDLLNTNVGAHGSAVGVLTAMLLSLLHCGWL